MLLAGMLIAGVAAIQFRLRAGEEVTYAKMEEGQGTLKKLGGK